jgi:hypothetical protein
VKLKHIFFPALLFAFALSQFASTLSDLAATPALRTLNIKLNYTGAGKVDEKHKIYVLLFDANPMTASTLTDSTTGPTPPTPVAGVSHIIARESAAAKNATITFNKIAVTPIYAMAFFDKNGTYNGHPDSASGSPMGIYGIAPDKLDPIAIESGKTNEITLVFDDSKTTP